VVTKPGEPAASEVAAAGGAVSDVDLGAAPEPAAESLERELKELRDRNLRLMAESQNAQKRLERDKQEALRYAEFDFARALLPIVDDLERTLDAARTGADLKAVTEGVRIVHEHVLKVLRERGIQPIDAAGQPFDPTHHEALLQQPSDEFPAGTVIQEAARGYTMHERTLRPARVIVSSGPPGRKDEPGE
jgi:molecular chaperone GrpE